MQYDAAGNMTNDGDNSYLYDAEGRICAVNTSYGMVQYIYDAAGARVAKGTISIWSCDQTTNGFAQTNQYILGPGGEQLTEEVVTGGTPAWKHTNVYAGGALIATYENDGTGPHFRLTDWLGTMRAQTNYAGILEQTCTSLPFGDTPTPCISATEQFFTGKERDTETGNDYFGARYYNSNMARWFSPDWSAKHEPVPYAKLTNQQSLNLYQYVGNNPTTGIDGNGHETQTYDLPGLDRTSAQNAPMSRTEMKVWGGLLVGAALASGAGELAAIAARVATAATTLCLMNCNAITTSIQEAAPGAGSFSPMGRSFSEAETSTGERLAQQLGMDVKGSSHIGEEFVAGGKTYDAMGGVKAYENWNPKQFVNSIDNHLNKSVDFVALDLKGASKEQIGIITQHVKGLSKEAQDRIKYVQ